MGSDPEPAPESPKTPKPDLNSDAPPKKDACCVIA
jgi:hypothetical protein